MSPLRIALCVPVWITLCAIIIPQSPKCLYRFDSFYMQNDEKAELNCEKHTNNNYFLYKIIQIYMALCGWPFFSEKWDEKVIKLNGSYIVKKYNLK